jgi:hypothetical protein
MSNYSDEHEKIANQLDILYKRHRELDDSIINRYNKFATDSEINMMKTKKLWFKDEIYRLEKRLKEI